jgi:hypothetical protein
MYLFEDNPFETTLGRFQSARTEPAAIHPRSPAPLFSSEEHCVLRLADRDTLRSLAQPGRIGRTIEWIFAVQRLGPLANPMFETLRRTAILLREKGRLTADETARFYEVRYSPDHLDDLRRRYGVADRSLVRS